MCKKHKLLESLDEFIESVHMQQRDREIRKIAGDIKEGFQEYFRHQGDRFLEMLDKQKNEFPEEMQEAINDHEIMRLLDEVIMETDREGRKIIEDSAGQLMLFAHEQLVAETGFEIDFDLDHPRAVEYLEKHAGEAITNIDETTRDRIARIVTEGLDDGVSYTKMAEEIEDEFEEFAVGKPQEHIRSRAELVAVTESANAYESGLNEVGKEMEKQGLKLEHHWETVGDGRVSDGCQENNRAGWIDFEEDFPSGDHEPPRFPGCRCASLIRRKRDD